MANVALKYLDEYYEDMSTSSKANCWNFEYIAGEKPLSLISREETVSYSPKTPLGKKLWEIRKRAIASSESNLLNWDELEQEIADRRGEK